jgi:hypothetical protein
VLVARWRSHPVSVLGQASGRDSGACRSPRETALHTWNSRDGSYIAAMPRLNRGRPVEKKPAH